LCLDALSELSDGRAVADIAAHVCHIPPSLPRGAGSCLGRLKIGDDDVEAITGEAGGDGPADPSGSSCDHCHT
jgi:hypothetical protein